jgi:hypothetical protein
VLFHDAPADPEAQAGAQFALGGKEGLEDLVQMALQNTWTAVGNRHRSAGFAVGKMRVLE